MRDVTGPPRGFWPDLIAAAGGTISFERFMQEALYHPEHGYYSRRIRAVGRTGDFSTSATLHDGLGQAVAAWVEKQRCLLSKRTPWHLIELGGGGGEMARAVLRGLGWWARRGLSYHIVDRSRTLRAQQAAFLQAWSSVSWHEEIGSALAAAGGEAILFSNEFVDAFPCARFERATGGDWREIGVRWDAENGKLAETLLPLEQACLGDGTVRSSVSDPAVRFGDAQRVEWHRPYAEWLRTLGKSWTAGAMLTIDYGDLFPALYHRRPAGTVRAYHQHKRGVGHEIYLQPGGQDLTADVNFTDLIRWGDAFGMPMDDLCTQKEFLQRWLPAGFARRHRRDPAFVFLTDEFGAGSAFKILSQRRVPPLAPAQNAP